MDKTRKQAVILQHNGGQLANQLWNFVSIYAYCLEKGYFCQNYSFFEYADFFNLPLRNKAVSFLFFDLFRLLRRFLSFRHARRITRQFYWLYVAWIRLARKKSLISTQQAGKAVYLSPTEESSQLLALENKPRVKTIYFDGWLFRNPLGLQKYRPEILRYFQPKGQEQQKAERFIKGLRKEYEFLVGVHLRQRMPGDAATTKEEDLARWENSEVKSFFYAEHLDFAREFLEQYLTQFDCERNKTCLVIFSNQKVDGKHFKGLNYVFAKGDPLSPVEDLIALAQCDVIIGSNTSYGPLAAYWGNKPFVVFQENPDWSYYLDKKAYFENKYLTALGH